MRARLAIAVGGFTVEMREILLRDKPQDMLAISPKGTVPVLQLSNGRVLDESLDIMRYVLSLNDPKGWLKADQTITNAFIQQNDTIFKRHLNHYKYPNRYGDVDDGGEESFRQAAIILNNLNSQLEKQQGLAADKNTLADYAIFPFIRQFSHTNYARFQALGFKALEKWLEKHLESALFQTVMEKHAPWAP